MITVETTSYPVQIWIAGDHAKAIELCRDYCDDSGFCVTVTPTTYVYTGGQEAGVVVGLINYGRFPSDPTEIFERAEMLAMILIAELGQESASIQAPDKTVWLSLRDEAGMTGNPTLSLGVDPAWRGSSLTRQSCGPRRAQPHPRRAGRRPSACFGAVRGMRPDVRPAQHGRLAAPPQRRSRAVAGELGEDGWASERRSLLG